MTEILTPTFEISDPGKEAQNAESWLAVREFLNNRNRSVYLWGPCGTGKSFAASCLIAEAKKRERTTSFTTAPQFVRTMRLFQPGQKLLDWKYKALLVLDDIDKANWKPADVRSLWEVLNERMKPYREIEYHDADEYGYRYVTRICKTVITGNVKGDQLRSYLTDCAEGDETLVQSLFQRLHPIEVLEFSGKSLR